MRISNDLLELVGFLNSELLWVYVIILIISFYLITALFTWNIKKPLMFLGISSTIVGILISIICIFPKLLLPENLSEILSSITKSLLINGVICIVIGISMIVVFNILNTVQKKKQSIVKAEV